MNVWEFRIFAHEDWIVLFFFANLLVLAAMHQYRSKHFLKFIRIFQLEHYFASYASEDSLKRIRPFYLGCAVLMTSGFALWAYYVFDALDIIKLTAQNFFYGTGIITGFFLIRFFLIRILLPYFKEKDIIARALYRSFTYNTFIGIMALGSFLAYQFWLHKTIFLWGISYVLALLWLIGQIMTIRFFLRSYRKHFFYLIFYLCAIRIGPWLWLYEMLITDSL